MTNVLKDIANTLLGGEELVGRVETVDKCLTCGHTKDFLREPAKYECNKLGAVWTGSCSGCAGEVEYKVIKVTPCKDQDD